MATRTTASLAPSDRHALQLLLGTQVDPAAAMGTPVALASQEAAAHQLVLGVTGAGKSAFLATLFIQLLNQGVGVFLIDPHGDLCDLILHALLDAGYFANPAAYQRLWYVDFACRERALPWNVLRPRPGAQDAHAIAQHLLEAWRRAWPAIGAGAAPLLETLVLASTYVLVENGLPLTALPRLLSEPAYRDPLLARVADQEVAAFFRRFSAAGRRAALLSESTLRRAFLLTFNPALRDCLGQTANRLHLRPLMDQGISLLCNLGGMDEEVQRFLGCLLTVQMEEAALSRADLPPHQRRPVHLLIDEWPVFASRSATAVEHLLSQARKYGVALTLACQTWGQTRGLAAALQNATRLITFRLGPEDAAWAAPRLFTADPYRIKHVVDNTARAATTHPMYMSLGEQRTEWEQWLQQLPARQAYVRHREGSTVRFRSLLLPPPQHSQTVLSALKDRFAQLLLTPRPLEQAAAAEAPANERPGERMLPHAVVTPAGVPYARQHATRPLPHPATGPTGVRQQHRRIAPVPDGDEGAGDDEA